jgi:hypothetical protein
MVNKYAGQCVSCRGKVPARGGECFRQGGRWVCIHLACKSAGKPQVNTVTFSSGESFIRNVRGRCEDAPCCGCCTI